MFFRPRDKFFGVRDAQGSIRGGELAAGFLIAFDFGVVGVNQVAVEMSRKQTGFDQMLADGGKQRAVL